MDRLYLVPREVFEDDGVTRYGPKYFSWRFDPDPPGIVTTGGYAGARYGLHPYILLLAVGIAQVDHDALDTYADVYVFPPLDQLDQSIAPQDNLDTFFEGINIPTDWLTPSSTYIEFVRQLMAIFQFNNRYKGLSVNVPLDTNQGIVAIAPAGVQDPGQDFSDWTDGNWAIHLVADWNTPDGVKRSVSWGALMPGANNQEAIVYSDARHTNLGWGGYFADLQSLVGIVGYKITASRGHDLFENITNLEDTYNDLSPIEQAWFDSAVESYGADPGLILPNMKFRQMLKSAGDWMASRTFLLGGMEF